MLPQWYDIEKIPLSSMWPDDHLWLPMLLNNQKFYGYFTFDGMDTFVDYSLNVVDDLDIINIPQAPSRC